MRRSLQAGALLTALALVAGCGGKTAPGSSAANPKKFMDGCNLHGLPRATRQTVVIIDSDALKHSEGGADFRAKNGAMMDALMLLVDPEKGGDVGNIAPREYVSIFLVPEGGSAPRLLFAGCAPGMSEQEKQKLGAQGSTIGRAADSFVGGGLDNELKEARDKYSETVLGALNVASQAKRDPEAVASQDLANAPLVHSIKAMAQLYDPLNGAARIVLFAPGAASGIAQFPDAAAARRAGFQSAKSSELDLGGADVVIAMAPDSHARDYVEAFALASSGNLVAWSANAPSELPAAPAWSRVYVGSIDIMGETYPSVAHISADAKGHLVNSWLEMRGLAKKSIPMTGTATCSAGSRCEIRSDDGGFAHRFYADRSEGAIGSDGAEPFGGMRRFEMSINDATLHARVFDPGISQVGSDPTKHDFQFSLTEQK